MERVFLLRRGNLSIPCRWTVAADSPPQRLFLGVHGFAGSKDDAIQKDLAEEMCLFGAAAICFDFPAHGENPEEVLTLRGCMDTLVEVARHAREEYPEISDLCLFATGFGAYVTLLALPELMKLPGKVKLVVQTPSVRMDKTLLAMTGLTSQTLWAMERYPLPTPRKLTVTYRFYEELAACSAMAEVPIPLLILHGQQDDYVDPEDLRIFCDLNDQAELVILPGVTHQFLEPGAWDMVVDLTRDWFDFEQVLLM